jgi:hypothetical protein
MLYPTLLLNYKSYKLQLPDSRIELNRLQFLDIILFS